MNIYLRHTARSITVTAFAVTLLCQALVYGQGPIGGSTSKLGAHPNAARMNNRRAFRPTQKGFGIPLKKVAFSNSVDQGILSCERGHMGILGRCVVRNMPLLHQMDKRLDGDVTDVGPMGCYDTSIATVVLTALANRTNKVPLTGRTKEFAAVPADGSIPKEVEQLSWFYRQAKKGAMLYLTEVLADFGKINESCNPDILANCTSATNQYGHTYYEFSDGKNWTNDFIIKKMREGYVMFIAYDRYAPNTTLKGKVTFTKGGPHKVVFSGFQIGHKFPLLINDVGTGTQHRVRLTTDLASRFAPSSQLGAPPSIVVPTELKTKMFMEYEGEAGPSNEVLFIAHMDALKLK